MNGYAARARPRPWRRMNDEVEFAYSRVALNGAARPDAPHRRTITSASRGVQREQLK